MDDLRSVLNDWKLHEDVPTDEKSLPMRIVEEAVQIIRASRTGEFPRDFWLDFLDTTRKSAFLTALGSPEMRNRWAEVVFILLQHTNYSLRDMLIQRVSDHPNRVLFRDMSGPAPVDWTYEQIYRHTREIAAVLYRSVHDEPRVALFTDNCLEGACTDISCLSYGIFITPLSIHFSQDILVHIFDTLQINIALADSRDRLSLLQKVQQKTTVKFIIFTLLPGLAKTAESSYLPEECKKLVIGDIDSLLEKQATGKTDRVATTMFTSGSTGLPKGVSFSIYNIVSKRFARAAALPEVGEETFLCYLPLFHTFGRYLELTGAIFWEGTYIFAGNTSAETLLSLFPCVNPTGFISIPLRWHELYEKCLDKVSTIENPVLRERAVSEVVGTKLKWGLSAAGYLDPKVFRFFNHYNIHLCSGFGMTEATGGITMTPPGEYRDEMVGIPLPGVRTRLTGESELELSGHYIGRYLEDAAPGDVIAYPVAPEQDHWMRTGDVFRVSDDGYYQIVDRVKDIYKNNRGQTVAPQVMEKKFLNVPGIKNTFLVGDNRPYNVLLIVPDKKDVIFSSLTGDNLQEYFHQIVMAANADVAPYERVINFALLERDFSTSEGEVTAKGSFNRKTIEKNFGDIIESLYISNVVTIKNDDITIQIPRWFYRDLGILENDILVRDSVLYNRRSDRSLEVIKSDFDQYLIGDFLYHISSPVIDLGMITRQPKLWLGNAALISFCPVKEGWDIPLNEITESIHFNTSKRYNEPELPRLKSRNPLIEKANEMISRSFFFDAADSFNATQELGHLFAEAEPRLATVIRHRLEALAFHPEEKIRTLAYRLLILKAPEPEELRYMPSFIESGLSFLNEESIREIAASNFGKHRLDALKQRLYWYRINLKWPAEEKNQQQFETILRMLFNFGVLHLDYYVSIRAELSRWILHKKDPYLSAKAEEYFDKLAVIFENNIEEKTPKYTPEDWKQRLVFEHGITRIEKDRITDIFQSTTFFQESIVLAFNEQGFTLNEVPERGIWILRLQAYKEFNHFRVSVNTTSGKHYDIHMVISENPDFVPNPDTFYWLASLAGYPFGAAVAPLLGSSRPSLGILSTQYIGGLTAWDRIREYSEIHKSAGVVRANTWKKLFITAISIIFKGWHHSGFQIVPGAISPANVAIPELDFRESARILSLTGWAHYRSTLSIISPVLQEFYCKTVALYPLSRKQIEIKWIFDSCIEALGPAEGEAFLHDLRNDLIVNPLHYYDNQPLLKDLQDYLALNIDNFYLPLALLNAIDQYIDWVRMNPLTTSAAREQTLIELMELYKLHGFAEPVRYHFYRYTYFAESADEIQAAFDRLLEAMQKKPNVLPIQMTELSDLQYAITDPEDKNIFSRMIFPGLHNEQVVDFLKVGEKLKEHVVVRFNLQDKHGTNYTQREPIEPREIGQLYQLFFRENYPKEISANDNHFVVVDENDKLIGGLTWRYLDNNNVLLDGIVVNSSLQGRGIASAMIENFFTNMGARDVRIIKAHFLFGNYYMKHDFKVDKKWGALIKILNE